MSRRFAINETEMNFFINGSQLKRFDRELGFKYPRDQTPPGTSVRNGDGWGVDELVSGRSVAWWIGFTHKPLQVEYHRGISVLGRDKTLQRPFLFERTAGTHRQLGQE